MTARNSGLLRSVASFSAVTAASRVLGLARDMAINITFGADAATDAFWVAFRIPNFLRRLFAEGSFSTAFVPVFTEVKETRSHAELERLVANVAGTLGGVLLVVTALGVLFAPQVALVFAPGAFDEPHKFGLTVDLLRLTFPFLLFVSLTALAAGVLNSFHQFALPAMAPAILNIALIVAALWLAPHLGIPIMALGWAILAAGIVQLVFLFPSLRRLDLLPRPRWGPRHPDVRKILKLMVPTLFGSSVAQVNLLLDTVIASLLVTGSQSWLSQSTRFLELPLGVFGVALGTVILPALSRHHVAVDRESFSRALDWGLRVTLLIAVPAMCALLLLAEPLVATLFQHQRFTAFDTRMATLSIMAMVCGLPAYALVKVLLPAFYSRQDTKTPVRAGVAALVVNMLCNVVFIALLYAWWAPPDVLAGPWLAGIAKVPGLHMALGIAGSVSSFLNFALLWRGLRRAGVYRREPGWARHGVRLAVACGAMTAVLAAGLWLWPDWTGVPAWTRVWHLALLVAAGSITYVAILLATGFRARDLRPA